jgi:hypothetical protein
VSELLAFGQPPRGIMQIAYIVPDIHAALQQYSATLAIGPWFVFEHFPILDYHYRGEPRDIDITLAIGFSGSMSFELIQQNDAGESVYTEIRDRRGWGFHHWAVGCRDFDAEVEFYRRQGFEMALSGRAGVGARAAYMDTSAVLPGMVELIELDAPTEAFFNGLKTASDNWDGSDPVRLFKA